MAPRAEPVARPAGGALRIIVMGYVVRGPLGGMTWGNLQYVLGLRDLGHDVWFAEDSSDWPLCYDPTTGATGTDPSAGLRYAADIFARAGVPDRWLYNDVHGGGWTGPAAARAAELWRTADVLLHVGGTNQLREEMLGVPARVLIDQDPLFTQVRHLTEPDAAQRSAAHTAFFTYGERIGMPGCTIPDDGLPWQPTRHPVVTRSIAPVPGPADGRFTTVGVWESYAARTWRGRRYGLKADSFEAVADLPARVDGSFEIALGGAGAPRDRLRDRGWRIVDPLAAAPDPETYLDYIAGSKGELSVAKHGYVASASGWFSERSGAYLASGRPVVAQDTGWSAALPAGEGLLGFTDLDGAVAAVEAVGARYARHCAAAREVAVAHLDAGAVLTSLLERALAVPREVAA